MDKIGIIFFSAALALMAVLAVIEVRFLVRRLRSAKWPTAGATIHAGFVGSIGKGGRAASFTYQFPVEDGLYYGRFILMANEEGGRKLLRELDGQSVQVRYNPRRPEISFLLNLYDARFNGVAASQNPYWLFELSELPGSFTRLFSK
jgi:Protein of unknown function (DUF3592)